MLNPRYKYDARPVLKLNPVQLKAKEEIESKIKQGVYRTEKLLCPICGGQNFNLLSEKDRFGLPVNVVICRDCGLIQTNPRLDQEAFNQFYWQEHTRLIWGEEQATKDIFLNEYFHGQKIYEYLKELIKKNNKELFVLEIGCGTGGILKYFRDQGFKVFGVDLDADCIECGRKNHGLDLRAGTLRGCEFTKKPDIIIMSHILEHLLNPNEELELIYSVLNKDGIVYMEVPGVRNLTFIHNDMCFLRQLQIPHVYHYSLTTLSNLLGKNGFRLLTGDERVRSVFKKGDAREGYNSDYRRQMRYLNSTEFLRHILPITPFRIKYGIEAAGCWVLERTGLYKFVRSIYRKMIKRTEPKK